MKTIYTSFILLLTSLTLQAQESISNRIDNYVNLISWDDDAPNFEETYMTDAGVLYHLGDEFAQGEDRFGEIDPEGFGHADKLNWQGTDHVYDLKPGDRIILWALATADEAAVRCKLNYLSITKENGDLSAEVTDMLQTADGESTVTLPGGAEGDYIVFNVPSENLKNELIAYKVIVTGHDADLLGIFVAPSFQTTKEDRRDNYLHQAVQGYGWNWVYDLAIPQAKEGDHPLVVCGPYVSEEGGDFQDGNSYFKWNNTDSDLPGAGGLGGTVSPTEHCSGWIIPETVTAFRTGFGFAYTGQISRVGIVKGNDAHQVIDMYFEPAFLKQYEYEEAMPDARIGDRMAFSGDWSSAGTCNVIVNDYDGNELGSGQFPFSIELTAENIAAFQEGNYLVSVEEGRFSGLCLWPAVEDSDDPSSISNLAVKRASSTAIYTLSGVRVANPQKGIYIKNGKKFIVK